MLNKSMTICYISFTHAKALGDKFDHVIKIVKVKPVSPFEQIGSYLSTRCCIPSFKVISLLVPKKEIFEGFSGPRPDSTNTWPGSHLGLVWII